MARPICILHLSDLHFSGSADADAKIVINSLLKDIERERATGAIIDIVIFSGDLVQAGKDSTVFDEAQKEFIEKVITAAGISSDCFFICPGNHDIDRDIVDKETYVEIGLSGYLKNREAINRFIGDSSKTALSDNMPEPFRRLNNFYGKIWFPRTHTSLISTPFVIAYSLPILDQNIGIACFNSAWRTTGAPNDVDQGNLIIGERAVDQAAEALKDTTIKVAVFHHPISLTASQLSTSTLC